MRFMGDFIRATNSFKTHDIFCPLKGVSEAVWFPRHYDSIKKLYRVHICSEKSTRSCESKATSFVIKIEIHIRGRKGRDIEFVLFGLVVFSLAFSVSLEYTYLVLSMISLGSLTEKGETMLFAFRCCQRSRK